MDMSVGGNLTSLSCRRLEAPEEESQALREGHLSAGGRKGTRVQVRLGRPEMFLHRIVTQRLAIRETIVLIQTVMNAR